MAAMFAKQSGLAGRIDEIPGQFGTPSPDSPCMHPPRPGVLDRRNVSIPMYRSQGRRVWVYARVAGGLCGLPVYRPEPAVQCRRPTLDMRAESCLGCKWTRRPLPISPTFAFRGVISLSSAVSEAAAPAWLTTHASHRARVLRPSVHQGSFIAAKLPGHPS